jgi:DNA replication ATP-dependent helicase Dna2
MDNARNKGWTAAFDQLQDHYRMHEDIAALITRHYRDGLRAALPVQVSRDPVYVLPPDHFLQAFTGHRVLFVESPREGGLKRNDKEALMAASIANALVGEGVVTPRQIGIITPFRAQVAAIRAHLRDQLLDNEDFIIDTVERYQGDERRIIIFSSTISDPRQIRTIQSVAEDEVAETDRKLLVSISRAIDQLIILGNSTALEASAIYRDLIGHIKEKGGYFQQFPLPDIPVALLSPVPASPGGC